MRTSELDELKARGITQCGCGWPFLLFRVSPDGIYSNCPNCQRDDGSGGAEGYPANTRF